jgi:hypothetical protein
MEAKDILRIALFILAAIFVLRSAFRTRVQGSVRVNSHTETEETETQQLFQRFQGNRINEEQEVYENQPAAKEI